MPDLNDDRTDAELITATQEGERDAFGELVRRHQRAAVRIAAVALGSATDADDVAQEAFVKAHAALPRFRPGAAFEPWFLRIVANTARNGLRSGSRRHHLALRAANLAVVGGPEPDEIAAHNADRERLIEALNRLRADDRLILTYRWLEELTGPEIAEALGCRPGTVMGRSPPDLGTGRHAPLHALHPPVPPPRPHGSERTGTDGFVHVLDLDEEWAVCLDLPPTFGGGPILAWTTDSEAGPASLTAPPAAAKPAT